MNTMIESIEQMKTQRDDLNKKIHDAERNLKRCIERPVRIWNISDPDSYYGKREIEKLAGQYYVIIPIEMIQMIGCEHVSSCFESMIVVDRDTLMIKVNRRSVTDIGDTSVEKYVDSIYEHRLRSIEIIIENWEHGVFETSPEKLIERIKEEIC